jgi:putative two-component system response regulator
MGDKKSVLVIDNDKEFTSLIDKFLRDICGYEVKVIPDGYNGILTAKRMMPELIILDVRMPAMNGLGILEKLKSDEDTAQIPIVILTGFDDDEIRNKALALKAADYLTKPIDLEVLRSRVAQVIK